MRNLIFSLLFLVSGCAVAPVVSPLPQALYADGTSFSLPCSEHGSHLQTIQSHSIEVIYSITDDQGNVQKVPEFAVKEVLDALGINPNEKSGQQAPADQVFPAPGTIQPQAGSDTGPTGNR